MKHIEGEKAMTPLEVVVAVADQMRPDLKARGITLHKPMFPYIDVGGIFVELSHEYERGSVPENVGSAALGLVLDPEKMEQNKAFREKSLYVEYQIQEAADSLSDHIARTKEANAK